MAVTRLEIVRREPYEGGRAFGAAGPYERIDAVAHYAVDPAHPANSIIVDLDRAERAGDGKVHFNGDATYLVPADAARANRGLLLEVPNRGNRIAMRSFCMAPFDLMPTDEIAPGDGFLLERGWSIAWCGWQWDVPHPSIRMGLRAPGVPAARRVPASRMQLRIQPDRDAKTFALTDHHVGAVGNHAPIPPLDPHEPGADLLMRDHLFDDPVRIPRDRWAFVRRDESTPVPVFDGVTLSGGFEAGRIYDLVYTPAGCPVVGAGLLAVRDLAAWSRGSEESPAAGRVDHLIAEGVSQCGRFLRTFLHAGPQPRRDRPTGVRRGPRSRRGRAPGRIQSSPWAAIGAADPERRAPLPVCRRAADRTGRGVTVGAARPVTDGRRRTEDRVYRHVLGVLAGRRRTRAPRSRVWWRRGAASGCPPLPVRKHPARSRRTPVDGTEACSEVTAETV